MYPVVSPEALPAEGDLTGKELSPRREITVTDRATAYSLLANDPSLCLLASPMPSFLAAQMGLIQRPAAESTVYRDLLICRRDYRLTATDEAFLRALKGTARAMKE